MSKQIIVDKSTRVFFIVFSCILTLTLGVVFLKESNKVTTKIEERELINYLIEFELNPKIKLIENSIYENEFITIDNFLVKSLIEKIDLDMELKMNSTIGSKINGEMNKFIHIKSFYGEDLELLWEKKFELGNLKLEGNGELIIKDKISETLYEADNFLKKAYEETYLEPVSICEIGWEYKGKVMKEKNIIPFFGKQFIVIPMSQNVLKIDKKSEGIISDRKAEKVEFVEKEERKSIYAYLVAISFLGIIFSAFILKNRDIKYTNEKTIKTIFKNYGGYLVELKEGLVKEEWKVIKVKKIEDLVRISDERRQPIFYKEIDGEGIEFCIMDGIYIYYLFKTKKQINDLERNGSLE